MNKQYFGKVFQVKNMNKVIFKKYKEDPKVMTTFKKIACVYNHFSFFGNI